ncbi:MAG: type II toxin-antitoxin system VapC family toxin [Deltaproteobacteria bacterium]|jgi:PIN domain nuclease of toxin-antitoxin system|nr:type II toxin-antitoxin system VapC family toxin [Deltaproteobacteria bacterium]MBT7205126.1 type II toxin-antitoxin system VapC family toxin [Deltaproteobacteria bacterium]
MKLLLDTHIFLWALSEPNRLSQKQVNAVEDPTNTVYVSSISITEIAIKASLGKLELVFDPLDAAEKSGFEMLDFSAKDALLLKDLPFHHRDPFDRMLITQAISRRLIIATQGSLIDQYDCRTLR